MIASQYAKLIEDVKKNEGFSETVYFCSEGVGTIGYGTTFVTKEEAEYLLKNHLKRDLEFVEGYLLNEDISLDEFRVRILTEMCYQLGPSGLRGFKKMFSALRNFDYDQASVEMMDSKWAKQTPVRAKVLATRMKIGY